MGLPALVGDTVGDAVGDEVGDEVGDAVGDADGDTLGGAVGDIVGDAVVGGTGTKGTGPSSPSSFSFLSSDPFAWETGNFLAEELLVITKAELAFSADRLIIAAIRALEIRREWSMVIV